MFYKQRDNLFFPVSAYVLPTTVLRLPYSLFLATTWSVVVYWSCGFAPSAGRYARAAHSFACMISRTPPSLWILTFEYADHSAPDVKRNADQLRLPLGIVLLQCQTDCLSS